MEKSKSPLTIMMLIPCLICFFTSCACLSSTPAAEPPKNAALLFQTSAEYSLGKNEKWKHFSLTFTDVLSGAIISTENLKEVVIVLQFWFSECPPCREETQNLRELYEKYHPQGVEFIGISLDMDVGKLIAFCQEQGVSWPQYHEANRRWDNSVALAWDITSTPTILVFNRKHDLVTSEARDDLENTLINVLRIGGD
jgi:thiol-disulfide isomerase/thioredoxin